MGISISGEKGCADVYTQCGGGSGPWSGPRCCAAGCTCEPNGPYDDQCKPPKGEYKCVVKDERDEDESSGKDDEDDDDDDEVESRDEDEDDKDDGDIGSDAHGEKDDKGHGRIRITAKYFSNTPLSEN